MSSREWFAQNWFGIVTGLAALLIIATACALVILQRPFPNSFENILLVVVTFFFGVQVPRPAAMRRADIQATAQIIHDVQSSGE